ncbi:MAG: DnaJ C-terminal domain-containing protein [Xanthobacteraceae bacterium]
MRDPYEVLGVSKNASAAEIKSAFRRQAKKLHPDANKHDPKAATRFAELNAAYEILGEESKRKAFDRGEIDAEGKPRFRGFEGYGAGHGPGPGFSQDGIFEAFTFGRDGFQRAGGRAGGGFRGFGPFDDILKDAFGSAARGRPGGGFQFGQEEFGGAGQDVTAALTITLTEAAKGTHKRVHLPTGKEVDVKIPPGLNEGQTIRLKGQGLAGPRGRAGDLLIAVAIAPHPLFAREGADLRLELPIALYEAVLGAKVRVPTLDGAVELAIPAGTNSGRTFRLKGKGFPAKDGKGDLLACVRIILPERADPELDELMRRWRETRPYDPRKDMA